MNSTTLSSAEFLACFFPGYKALIIYSLRTLQNYFFFYDISESEQEKESEFLEWSINHPATKLFWLLIAPDWNYFHEFPAMLSIVCQMVLDSMIAVKEEIKANFI